MDQGGIVQFVGRRTFMAGQVQAMRTPMVTFRAGILGQLQSVDVESAVDAKAAAR
jgi:hypothetical protein